MATYPLVTGTVKSTFKWSDGVGHFGARMFWVAGTPPFNDTDMKNLADAMWNAWSTDMASFTSSQYALVEIDVLDLSDVFAHNGAHTGSLPGSGSTGPQPSNAAIKVQAKIGARYRGGHPVFHLPPPSDAAMQNTRQLSSTSVTGILAGWNSFLTAVKGTAGGPLDNPQPVILRNYKPGVLEGDVKAYAPLAWNVGQTLGSMRRRLSSA